MSSWCSGSVISRTASSPSPDTSAAQNAPSRTRHRDSRQPPAPDPGAGRSAGDSAAGGVGAHGGGRSSLASTWDRVSLNSSRLPSFRTSKSARSAFSSWDSWRPVRSATAAWPRAPGALGAHVLVGHDRDRGVERRLHPRFEQERHLDDRGSRRRGERVDLLPPLHHPPADARPELALEPARAPRRRRRRARRSASGPARRPAPPRRRGGPPRCRAARRSRAGRGRPRPSRASRPPGRRAHAAPRTCLRRGRR